MVCTNERNIVLFIGAVSMGKVKAARATEVLGGHCCCREHAFRRHEHNGNDHMIGMGYRRRGTPWATRSGRQSVVPPHAGITTQCIANARNNGKHPPLS